MAKKILFLKAKTGIDDPSPPMAFGYLGAIALEEGFRVIVENLNAQYNKRTEKNIVDLIKKENPEIIGMHIFTNSARESYKLMKKIKPFSRLIIAGGPHATACSEEVIKFGADIAFIGEAEISFREFLKKFKSKKDFEKIKGIAFIKNGKIIKTPPQKIIFDLDKIPFSDREVHRKSDYIKSEKEINNYGQILSTRGCPGRCSYCFSVFSKCYRYASAKRVFSEIEYLNKKYGINFINFIDDAFTINKERLLELCKIIIQSKIDIQWVCATRIDFLDEEVLRKMREAGCVMISLGFESSIPETLINVKKTSNPEWYVEQHNKILKECYKLGIRIGVNTLTGFPWESAEDIKKFHKYAKSIRKYVTQGFDGGIIQPQPGTEIYEKYAEEYGFKEWWIHKKLPFEGGYRPFFTLYYLTYWDHLQNNFFRFDRNKFEAIDKFYKMMGRWNLYIRTARRFRNPLSVSIVYNGAFILSKISLWIYNFSPKIERIIMEKLKKFSYQFKFRKGRI